MRKVRAATILFYFSGAGSGNRTLFLFIVSQTCFVAANVFYDAFLCSARGVAFPTRTGRIEWTDRTVYCGTLDDVKRR